MIQLFPIDANDQIIEADFDSETYYVGVSWNETGQFWTFSLRNLAGELLSSSIPAVPFWPLLRQIRNPSCPPGELMLWLKNGAVMDRQAFNQGSAALFYLEAAELAAAAA